MNCPVSYTFPPRCEGRSSAAVYIIGTSGNSSTKVRFLSVLSRGVILHANIADSFEDLPLAGRHVICEVHVYDGDPCNTRVHLLVPEQCTHTSLVLWMRS